MRVLVLPPFLPLIYIYFDGDFPQARIAKGPNWAARKTEHEGQVRAKQPENSGEPCACVRARASVSVSVWVASMLKWYAYALFRCYDVIKVLWCK